MVKSNMSHGSSTSLSLFSLSLCSQSPKLLLRRTQVSASSISSPKPFVKRRNHLRPKLLGIRTPTPPPPPSPPPPPPPVEADEAPAPNVLVLEVEEAGEALVLEEEVIDRALLHEHHRWFPGPVLDLGIKFAALLVVQTVVAVWVLGGGDGSSDPEERRDGGDAGEEKVVVVEEEREVGVLTEFDKKVMEIRAMAKVARMSEEKDLGDESGVKGEVGQRLDWLRKRYALVDIGDSDSLSSSFSSSKKMGGKRNGGASKPKGVGFLSPGVKVHDAPKGFNGSKGNDECIHGGIQQIAHQNYLKDSVMLHEPRKPSPNGSEVTEKIASVEDIMNSPCEDWPNAVDLHTSGEQLEGDEATGVSRKKNASGLQKNIESGSSFDRRNCICSENRKANISKDASLLENRLIQSDMQVEQSSAKVSLSTSSGSINSRLESSSQIKEIEPHSVVNKDNGNWRHAANKSWWQKLPYILAIYLRRGFDHNGPSGLYSLKMDSPSRDGISPFYTIGFQDRGDATNFCYLLESFFEDLGDVSADIVPLTIQELDEVVKSGEEVIVVKKGQLQLYAGQPLVEVETALRSLID